MDKSDFSALLGPHGETLDPPGQAIYSGGTVRNPVPPGTTVEAIRFHGIGSYVVVRDMYTDSNHVLHLRQLTPRLDPPLRKIKPITTGVSLEEITKMLGDSLLIHVNQIEGHRPVKENMIYLAEQIRKIPEIVAPDDQT